MSAVCVIGSEKLFPQYMHKFEPLSKPHTTVGEEHLSLKLCVRSQLLLHCWWQMTVFWSPQSIFVQMVQEKEVLEMVHWCFPAKSASGLCVEVFGSQQEMMAEGSLEQKLEIRQQNCCDLWGSSHPQSLVGTTYLYLLLLMEKAEKCKQTRRRKYC